MEGQATGEDGRATASPCGPYRGTGPAADDLGQLVAHHPTRNFRVGAGGGQTGKPCGANLTSGMLDQAFSAIFRNPSFAVVIAPSCTCDFDFTVRE